MPMQTPSPATISSPPTRRRLNLRLFGSLLGIAAALAVGLHFLHGWQTDRNADSLLEKAEAAVEEGDSAKAIQFYTQYLKYRPNNIEAQASLGMLLDQPAASGKMLLNAFMLYESILREDPSRETIRRHLADVLMRLGRFPDALGHFEVLLSRHPRDADLLFRKARCKDESRHYAEAAALYAQAVQHDRREIKHHTALIQLVLDHEDALELSEIDPHHRQEVSASLVVEALSERMVAQGLPRARAFLARSRQRMRDGDLALAVADIREALQLAEKDPEILFTAAEMELAQAEAAALEGSSQQRESHVQAAKEIAIRGLKQDPPALKLEYIIARIAIDEGDVAGSIQAFTDGLSHFPDILHDASAERKLELAQVERQLLFGLADLRIRFPGEKKTARSIGSFLERIRQLGTPPEYLDFLLAEQAIQESEWARAIIKLEPLRASLRTERDLSQRVGLLLSHCYRAVGNPDARLAVLHRTIEEFPLWTAGHLEYARALAESQHIQEAAKEYRMLLGVEGVATKLFRLQMLEELALPQNRRNWNRVEETLDMAARANVDPIELNTLRAEVRLQQKKYGEAAELLQSALEKSPDRASTHAAKALLALRRDDWSVDRRIEVCREALLKAEADLGPLPEWELIRAELALSEPEPAARKTLNGIKDRAGHYSPAVNRQLLERVAQVYRERKLPEQSREVWRELAERHPNELKYWQALAQPLSDQGRVAELEPILQKIRRIEGGQGPTSQFLYAVAMLVKIADGKGDSDDLDQATQILEDMARKHPHWAAVVRARGHAAELGGDSDLALRYFQEALRLGDSSPEVVLRILQNLASRGQQEEAMQLASRLASEGNPVFTGEAGRFARALALQQQNLEGAVQFAQEVWKNSNDYWDQLWLAEVRFQSGARGPEVDELYRQAVRQAPEEPATWLGLIRHLQRTGQFAQARAMIAEAKKHLPEALLFPTLARCYEILGDWKEAAKWHHQAVVADPTAVSRLKAAALFHDRIGNHEEAKQYLNQIADKTQEARPSDIAWTRRNQALLLAAEGGYDRSVKAVELLERNARGPHSEELADLKAKAIILSKRRLRKDRLEAIRVFLEIGETRGYLAQDEQLELARLYQATGQWEKARPMYQQIVTSDAGKPEHLAEFAVSLIRHDEAAEAAPWVRTLERKAPDAFATATTQARFSHSMGNSQLALETIKSWVKSHRPADLDVRVRELPQQASFEKALADLLAVPGEMEPGDARSFEQSEANGRRIPAGGREDIGASIPDAAGSRASNLRLATGDGGNTPRGISAAGSRRGNVSRLCKVHRPALGDLRVRQVFVAAASDQRGLGPMRPGPPSRPSRIGRGRLGERARTKRSHRKPQRLGRPIPPRGVVGASGARVFIAVAGLHHRARGSQAAPTAIGGGGGSVSGGSAVERPSRRRLEQSGLAEGFPARQAAGCLAVDQSSDRSRGAPRGFARYPGRDSHPRPPVGRGRSRSGNGAQAKPRSPSDICTWRRRRLSRANSKAARRNLEKAYAMQLSEDRLHPLEKQLYDRLIHQLPAVTGDVGSKPAHLTKTP